MTKSLVLKHLDTFFLGVLSYVLMVWLLNGDEKNHLSPFHVEKLKMAAIILLYFYHVSYIYFHIVVNLVAVYKFGCTQLFISG